MIFDPSFTMMEKALDFAATRQQAIAQNIANVNTPGYKRTEVSFPTVLADIMSEFRTQQQEAVGRQRKLDDGSMTPMEVSFVKADIMFQQQFGGPEAAPGGPNPNSVTAKLLTAEPEVAIDSSGSMRFDGNNVSIDAAIADLAKNNMGYSNITALLSSDFKLLRTVIEAK